MIFVGKLGGANLIARTGEAELGTGRFFRMSVGLRYRLY